VGDVISPRGKGSRFFQKNFKLTLDLIGGLSEIGVPFLFVTEPEESARRSV
jgi:hypothetical protein